MFYNKYRPRRFEDVVGQESEKKVLYSILQSDGIIYPPLLITGPYGTGKTTFSRIVSAAILCEERQGIEPCGECAYCRGVFEGNSINYREIDSSSQGLVMDMRALKDEANFAVVGGKYRIFTLDESHLLSVPGQNSLLQILEAGKEGVLFVFATTNYSKMIPTIRSRSVVIRLKLLTVAEIYNGLLRIAKSENIEFEDKALKVIATYVRGHLRDAIVLLEQIYWVMGKITEEGVRIYLRLDKSVVYYDVLLAVDDAVLCEKLERLLCEVSVREVLDGLGKACLDAYKVMIGYGMYDALDKGWLQKVGVRFGSKDVLLERAEKFLMASGDVESVDLGIALITRILMQSATSAPIAAKAQQPLNVMNMRKVPK